MNDDIARRWSDVLAAWAVAPCLYLGPTGPEATPHVEAEALHAACGIPDMHDRLREGLNSTEPMVVVYCAAGLAMLGHEDPTEGLTESLLRHPVEWRLGSRGGSGTLAEAVAAAR